MAYKFKNLSQSDIKILKENYSQPLKNGKLDKKAQQEELEQIDRFLDNMLFTFSAKNGKEEYISQDLARAILGQDQFLSGLDRAVFHQSAVRENNGFEVSFDASNAWEIAQGKEPEEPINYKELTGQLVDAWCDKFGFKGFVETFDLPDNQLQELGFSQADIDEYRNYEYSNEYYEDHRRRIK